MHINGIPYRADFAIITERFMSKVSVPTDPDGCWVWSDKPKPSGYGVLNIRNAGKPQLFSAHRLSYVIHIGPIPDHHVGAGETLRVCHRCDTRLCVNPKHLFLGTDADNLRDMERKGRSNHPKGEASGMAKLTDTAVLAIRADRRSTREIAKHYGVDHGHVGNIKRLEVWKHLDGPAPFLRKRGARATV